MKETSIKNFDFEKIVPAAVNMPGIKINRADFLRRELSKNFSEEIVSKAIRYNPAKAGIDISDLKKIAKDCINYETTKVTAISTVAGIPGGIAMAATIPTDIVQYFGHIIRILQKLVYLYGWQDIFDDSDNIDDGTYNELILFMGVMFGVRSANVAIAKIAKVAAVQAEKQLVKAALTKGTIYPIVKKIAISIGFKMNKEIFAKSVGKMIPVAGAVLSGVVTFVGFKPMTTRLHNYLIELPIADTEFYKNNNDEIVDVDDIDFSDIEIVALDN